MNPVFSYGPEGEDGKLTIFEKDEAASIYQNAEPYDLYEYTFYAQEDTVNTTIDKILAQTNFLDEPVIKGPIVSFKVTEGSFKEYSASKRPCYAATEAWCLWLGDNTLNRAKEFMFERKNTTDYRVLRPTEFIKLPNAQKLFKRAEVLRSNEMKVKKS